MVDSKVSLISLVLHFNKTAPELTEAESKQLIKGLLDTLRLGAKAKGWEYWIWVAYSEENLRALKKPDRHIHILLYYKGNSYGKQGIIDSLKRYWSPPDPKPRKKGDKPKSKRQKWGKVCSRKVYNAGGYLDYFRAQASYKVREQHSGGAERELPLDELPQYEIAEEEYKKLYKTS